MTPLPSGGLRSEPTRRVCLERGSPPRAHIFVLQEFVSAPKVCPAGSARRGVLFGAPGVLEGPGGHIVFVWRWRPRELSSPRVCPSCGASLLPGSLAPQKVFFPAVGDGPRTKPFRAFNPARVWVEISSPGRPWNLGTAPLAASPKPRETGPSTPEILESVPWTVQFSVRFVLFRGSSRPRNGPDSVSRVLESEPLSGRPSRCRCLILERKGQKGELPNLFFQAATQPGKKSLYFNK